LGGVIGLALTLFLNSKKVGRYKTFCFKDIVRKPDIFVYHVLDPIVQQSQLSDSSTLSLEFGFDSGIFVKKLSPFFVLP